MNNSIENLPEVIKVGRSDPIYNCHSYLTKIPVNAIQPFLETFSKEDDMVADLFAGSGMTGLAAIMSGRNAKLSDISVLGQHVALGYLQKVSSDELLQVGQSVISKARNAIGDIYQTRRISDNTKLEMIRTVWSFTYICPDCKNEMIYFEHLDKNGKPPSKCVSCKKPFVKRFWKRTDDVPVRIVVKGEDNRQVEQNITKADLRLIAKAANDKRQKNVPTLKIDEQREMYSRSGLGKSSMTDTAKFFSPRNALALLELWTAINEIKNKKIRQKLRFAFTAVLPRASKRYQWSPKRPLNAQNQTYYIAPVFYEWNVFELFERKINASIKASTYLFGNGDLFPKDNVSVTYNLSSADRLKHLVDNSIDYIFTDPPFGSNIFYSDMNLFHEAWLGKITNQKKEAVVYTTGKKKVGAQERYQMLLLNAFKEAYRVLKPGKYMSVVFGNSSGKIWGLVQRAIRDAGFKAIPSHVAILDKGQRSVKGLSSGSESVVTVDLVLTVQKPENGDYQGNKEFINDIDKNIAIQSALEDLSLNELDNPSHVYARILKKFIEQHHILDDLHLSDVLIAIRNAGYVIDKKTSKLSKKKQTIVRVKI